MRPTGTSSLSCVTGRRNKSRTLSTWRSATEGPYDELIKEFRSGYAFIFDVLMDIGGWRDMHRHRRCQQIQQNFTTVHGYDVPPPLVQAGLDQEYRQAMDAVRRHRA